MTSGALYYLVSSVLAIAAFFLLIELVDRSRDPGADMLAVTRDAIAAAEDDPAQDEGEIGIAIPATMAILGMTDRPGCLLLQPRRWRSAGRSQRAPAGGTVTGIGRDAEGGSVARLAAR